jgi:Tfp pilus assembly protein PilO
VRDLQAVRQRFVVLATVLALIALGAGVFLLTPYGRSKERLQADDEQLRLEWQHKEAEYGPLANIDQKLVEARQQIGSFYRDRLPDQYSAISAELTKLAGESGVRLGPVKYDVDKDVPAPGVRALHIGASVTGQYVNIVKFLNALERDKLVLVPASVDLSEGQTGVSLDLRVDTYLRAEGEPPAGGM